MKLQEYFKNEQGSYIMEKPIRFQLLTLREQKVTSQYGEKFEVHLLHMGDAQEVTWELDDAQVTQKFTNSYQGVMNWQAKVGDLVDITVSTTKSGDRVFYKVQAATGADPAPMFMTGMAMPTPREPGSLLGPISRATTNSNGPDWGGTPRQKAFREAVLSTAQSLMVAGSKAHLEDDMKQEVKDIVLWSRETGDELEKTYPAH